MKFLPALALSFLLVFSLNSAPPSPIPLYEALQAGAVTIKASESSGSGIVVLKANGDVWIWTAAHVIGTNKADVTLIKQVVVGGRIAGQILIEAEVISVSEVQDLAVLKPRSTFFLKTGVKFESADYIPRLGEPIVHAGSFLGLSGAESITIGIVSFSGRVRGGLVLDQISATALPGSSGGGVWNTDGKLIGLVVSGYTDTFSFIVPVRRMHEWALSEKHPEWLDK